MNTFEFAARLRDLMFRRSMFAKQLAAKSGCSEHTIHHWMNMTESPSPESLDKLAKALGTNVDYLCGENEDRDCREEEGC